MNEFNSGFKLQKKHILKKVKIKPKETTEIIHNLGYIPLVDATKFVDGVIFYKNGIPEKSYEIYSDIINTYVDNLSEYSIKLEVIIYK